jgi:hypothetical protein
MNVEQYRALMSKARKQERYDLIDYLRYRLQNRKATLQKSKTYSPSMA